MHKALTVLSNGETLGQVTVQQQTNRKIFGTFTPGQDYEKLRPLFEEVARWSRQLSEAEAREESVDYYAWDCWIAAVAKLTAQIKIPALPQAIEEFAIEHTGTVEITLSGDAV